jgi:FixJ family two-component response regulator
VIAGKLNKQIAFELGTGERNVKAHRANMMRKLGVRSVAEVTRLAGSLGLEPR